eukprot:TRINITY_DN10620_c0_g2_i1.p1 TRINITY_DN10620_c0_g2~~TRINITY_DN10620_c0_g2_i1.p1  ORF type:complete len:597 (-),score=149.81 TRINITY_DN10620_c0_g2_i1:248-2038(-)
MLPKKVSTPAIEPTSSIACGAHWTLLITAKGEVWGTGGNSGGQLGLGHKKSTTAFTKVEQLAKVSMKRIAAGHHTAAVSVEGELYFWGTSAFGEELLPRKVVAISSKVSDVAVGGTMGVALDAVGKVWVWGSNSLGELGVNDYDPRGTPFLLNKLKNKHIGSLSCGKSFVIARCHKSAESLSCAAPSDSYVSRLNESNSTLFPEVNMSGDSNFSLKDPNQNLVLVLTRQRDFIEETLEKERNDKRNLENKNSELKAEIMNLKSCIERIEKEKMEGVNSTNEVIDRLNTVSHKLEEAYSNIAELEKDTEFLKKTLQDKDEQLDEARKMQEQVKKKYAKAKKTIQAHIEVQEKLVKENDGLMQKLEAQQMEYNAELNQFKEISPKQTGKIEKLRSQLIESNTIKEHQAKLIEENEIKIASLTNIATELQEKAQSDESEKASLQNELAKQRSLCSKYQEELKELDKQFRQVKKGVKKTLTTEKSKTEDLQQQHKETLFTLQSENSRLQKRVEHLENELQYSNDQIVQLNTIKQDLENRNHKLIYSLSHCTKDYEKTHSQQAENFALLSKSPPKNLIVSPISSKAVPAFGTCLTNSILQE